MVKCSDRGSISKGLAPQRLVDVGCGTGVFTARVAEAFPDADVHGCVPWEGMLANGRRRSGGVYWHVASAEALPFEDGSVDVVISTEAFHFFDQPAALAEFRRVLAPGGHVVVASFNLPFDIPGPLLRLGPVSFTTPAGVRRLFEDAGLEVLEQRTVGRRLGALVPTRATVARTRG